MDGVAEFFRRIPVEIVRVGGSVPWRTGLLGLALRSLPVGMVYAVWTGIGTVGTAIQGIRIYGEPAGALRLACIALIVAGIAGLKILSP